MEPTLIEVKGGWHAIGRDWAVFGATKEEAIRKYREAEARHEEMQQRQVAQPIGA